jgi:hypothetical protein
MFPYTPPYEALFIILAKLQNSLFSLGACSRGKLLLFMNMKYGVW